MIGCSRGMAPRMIWLRRSKPMPSQYVARRALMLASRAPRSRVGKSVGQSRNCQFHTGPLAPKRWHHSRQDAIARQRTQADRVYLSTLGRHPMNEGFNIIDDLLKHPRPRWYALRQLQWTLDQLNDVRIGQRLRSRVYIAVNNTLKLLGI